MENEKTYNQNYSSKIEKWIATFNSRQSRANNIIFKPKNSALLVIDMQEFFLDKKSHAFIPTANKIIPRINLLINEYKKKEHLVIFTYHVYETDEDPGVMQKWWGDVLRLDNPLSRISKQINYEKSDIAIQKNRYSAFIGTDLLKILKKQKIKQVVITGVMTHLCCETTARDAFMKDFEVFFTVDATATSSESLHFSSLNTLSDGFAVPVKADKILQEVRTS